MAEDFPDVLFDVPADKVEALLAELRQESSLDISVVPSAGAKGGGDVVSVLVQLTPPVLSFLSGVIVAWMAMPGASIEIDGTKLKATGVSRTTVEELLRQNIAKAASQPTTDKSQVK
jgi:hypothetical protein